MFRPSISQKRINAATLHDTCAAMIEFDRSMMLFFRRVSHLGVGYFPIAAQGTMWPPPPAASTSASAAAAAAADAAEAAAKAAEAAVSFAAGGGSSSPEKPKRKRPKFIRKVECQVCGDTANDHVHYGAIACYSCRAFFRRGVNSNAPYYCSQSKTCPITK